jgi:hypothetical protein
VLILPNIASMTDAQVTAVRRFVARGGALIASGQTSLFDEWGDARADFALGDLLGVKRSGASGDPRAAADRLRQSAAAQTYLRLTPELRARVEGPHVAGEPLATRERHPVLAGFDETDILPYGGTLDALGVDPRASALLTFIPAFPAFPPETAWMRQPRTDIPGLVINESANRRVAFLSADIDRRFAIDNLPDHGNLMANLVRWAARDTIPLHVEGPGLLDCELYRQSDRLLLHVVNLTSAGSWRAPVDEIIPVGPLRVRVRLPAGLRPRTVTLRVAGGTTPAVVRERTIDVRLRSVLDHELIVIE